MPLTFDMQIENIHVNNTIYLGVLNSYIIHYTRYIVKANYPTVKAYTSIHGVLRTFTQCDLTLYNACVLIYLFQKNVLHHCLF